MERHTGLRKLLLRVLLGFIVGAPFTYAHADWLKQITAQPGQTSAIITWISSTESTGQIKYGTTSNYSFTTPKLTPLITSHSIQLTNLLANTLYHYRVTSIDAKGRATSSGDYTFTTSNSAQLQSITVLPSSATILVGQTYQFSASGVYNDGSSRDIASQCVWSSSGPSIAVVNNSGLATGMAAGGVGIVCTLAGISNQSVLTVAAIVVQHTVTLKWLASITPTATGYNVYRTLTSGLNYQKIGSTSGISNVQYIDATVSGGKTYFYVITALCPTCTQKTESAYSNEVQSVIP